MKTQPQESRAVRDSSKPKYPVRGIELTDKGGRTFHVDAIVAHDRVLIVDVDLAAVLMDLLRALGPIFGYAPEIFGVSTQKSRSRGGPA